MAVFTEKLFHNYFLRYLFFTYLVLDDINTLWPAYGRDGGRVLYSRDRGILSCQSVDEDRSLFVSIVPSYPEFSANLQ